MTHLLWPNTNLENIEDVPTLIPYLVEHSVSRGAIIICPGGSYQRRANHEGEPVAKWLNKLGISAFVLNYRVAPYKHPVPLADIQRAIRFVRFYSKEWNLDKQKIAILGFSAGGHLVASASTLSSFHAYPPIDKIDQESSRPNFAILCYPVISFLKHFHEGSLHNLLGENPTDELRAQLSHELNVSPHTPPTFLWHTADDGTVPVENSLLYAAALSKWNIPYEMHIFPNGRHGLGLAEKDEIVGQWKNLCENWLFRQGF
ncbi:alpha/beta hydrolase [Ureibacillus sp. 179-F W5.1 NHS]|uniref:Alpha/beta hydrolase n=1 Tax=Lysinibacillus halotolerans TaxID=1368476 RepID=A0A3M8HC33_9BACI|nr:alpha/beta hydrolase [Lysinibacillus halotolerans]RNC99889.1 alpha/beta hydrolase [Lysinibacillus halotolerans]